MKLKSSGKMKTGRPWSFEETLYLMRNRNNMTIRDLAVKLNRTCASVKGKLYRTRTFKEQEIPNPKSLSKWQWAYIAGLIDGEGTITVKRDKRKQWAIFSPHVRISMTDKEPMMTIKGWLEKAGFHPSELRSQEVDYFYGFQLCRSKEIIDFLEAIIPYLIAKKRHARVLREFCKSRTENFHKPYTKSELDLISEIRALNAPKSVGGYGHRKLLKNWNEE
jgi:hypothetical protein